MLSLVMGTSPIFIVARDLLAPCIKRVCDYVAVILSLSQQCITRINFLRQSVRTLKVEVGITSEHSPLNNWNSNVSWNSLAKCTNLTVRREPLDESDDNVLDVDPGLELCAGLQERLQVRQVELVREYLERKKV